MFLVAAGANANSGGGEGLMVLLMVLLFAFYAVVIILTLAALWKVFEKAGQPGWAAIVPFYNVYVLTCQVAKMEIVYFILYFIPCLSIAPAIMVPLKVAEKFRKGVGFGIGLLFLPFIFYPILGFGDAEYARKKKKRFVEEYDEEDDD